MGRGQAGVGEWSGELGDLLRGLTGGFLIGIPLLYTVETWWLGQTVSMTRALVFLVCAYALNFGFVTFAGFHRGELGSLRPFGDALEATALAIVATTVSLTLLHQLVPGMPLETAIGRIAVDTLPVSIGVSIANHLLGPGTSRSGAGDGEKAESELPSPGHAIALDLGSAAVGALFLSISIAPTEEVPLLATAIPVGYLPVMILFSLTLSYAIVFSAGFGGEDLRMRTPGPFQRPLTETVAAYVTSLVTAAALLALFGQIELGMDWALIYSHVIILGLPAAVGGAAGRLAA